MKRFKNRVYYTFSDVLGQNDIGVYIPVVAFVPSMASGNQSYNVYPYILYNDSGTTKSYPDCDKLLTMLIQRYFDHYCFALDEEDVSDDVVNRMKRMFRFDLLNIMNFTAPKYLMLLNLYEDQKTHLLDKVKSSTTALAKFNDTPQGSGDYTGDSYTTNVNRSTVENENDLAPGMERLNQIQQ